MEAFTGDLYVDRFNECAYYQRAFDDISAAASSVDDSRNMIASAERAMRSAEPGDLPRVEVVQE